MLEFDLLKIALKTKDNLDYIPSSDDWKRCLCFAKKQSLIGVLFYGIERLYNLECPAVEKLQKDKSLLMNWIGYKQTLANRNSLVNKRVKELVDIFTKGGFQVCLLKGQGNALYYSDSSIRQSGDIDLWVDGDRDKIIEFIKSLNVKVHDIHLVHANAVFFDDVVVEIHFQPTWLYNPFTARKLLSFINEQKDSQFKIYDTEMLFPHPLVYFNLVYNMLHINRHIFDEGIGLRQIVDYFYILKASDYQERERAFKQLKKLNMKKFTAALMYVMQTVLDMPDNLLLCSPNKRLGKHLLKDILQGGNFGMYGKYARKTRNEQRVRRTFDSFKRNCQFITTYPSEVLWIPYFKIWHWCWRKRKGYL